METAVLVALIGFLCICCFTVGARVGQKVVKGQEVKLPIKTPTAIIDDIKSRKEQKFEIERNKVIADNIDAYDGTSLGQKDVPKL